MGIQKTALRLCFVALSLLIITNRLSAQRGLQFSLYADPVISWFSSDTRETVREGARPGFNFGLEFNIFFAENYAFSTGIGLLNAGGGLSYADTTLTRFKNSTLELMPGESIIYKPRYLVIPLGLKLKTNEIGYMTIFANLGFDPKVVIGGNADIPAHDIKNENITEELTFMNLGYHIIVGTEYSLGGSTALTFGLGYEDNFLDITKDFSDQPDDRIKQRLIRFRLGIIF